MMSLEIGERLRVEAELRATQERYRQLVEEIPAVVYIWRLGVSEEGIQNYTSPQIERLLGFTGEEWNDAGLWLERLHPHDRERILAAAKRSATTGAPYEVEYRLLAKDGHVVWVADHSTLLSRDAQGKPLLFQGVLLDITARKEAEASEEQFRELIDSSPVVSWVYRESTPDDDPPSSVRSRRPAPISQLIGQSVEDLLADYSLWLRRDPSRRSAAARRRVRPVSRHEGSPGSEQFAVIGRDGRVVSVFSESVDASQRDADGAPQRFVACCSTSPTGRPSGIGSMRSAYSSARWRTVSRASPGPRWSRASRGAGGSRSSAPASRRSWGIRPTSL